MREIIVNALVEDEYYFEVKEGLHKEKVENKYEGYQLEDKEIFVYKGRIYVPSSIGLRKVVPDEIHQMPYLGHPSYWNTITVARKQCFFP